MNRKIAAFMMVAIWSNPASAADVDWKFYGGASTTYSGPAYCFYDERGIVRESNGFIRVWTKCLLQKNLDAPLAGNQKERAVIDMTASRIAHYYMPPITKVERMNFDQIMQVDTDEAIADVVRLDPPAQIFYELDCGQRKLRELSIILESSSTDSPASWRNVPPESNGAALMTLVCR
ncbi:MAG TPA: hypothetical protein VGG48_03495 [Rhizomicrobium sp.]|jgi:hypothetical protein